MLYDQAQLSVLYLHAAQITDNPEFNDVARDIFAYVARDLTHPGGGFYSAQDADSLPNENSTHKAEGAFALWDYSEVMSILGNDSGEIFCQHFDVQPMGNVARSSDPHHEFDKKNVLRRIETLEKTAQKFGKDVDEVKKILDSCLEKLWQVRKERPPPHKDDKIICSWNGMMNFFLPFCFLFLVFSFLFSLSVFSFSLFFFCSYLLLLLN